MSGFTSILRTEETPPLESDLQFLKSITKQSAASPLNRTQAHLTLGILHWVAGRRENAAREYRKGLECASASTAEQKAVMEMPSTGPPKQPVGIILEDVVKSIRDNLRILEKGTAPAGFFDYADSLLRVDLSVNIAMLYQHMT